MALNPVAAGLRNVTKQNIKVQLSIPPGASLDEVADQLVAAGMRESEAVPEFLEVQRIEAPLRRGPGRPRKVIAEPVAEVAAEDTES